MNKIYPKSCENLQGEEVFKEYINRYKGVEIQYFHKNKEKLVDFCMAPAIEKFMKRNPEIEEITIHPPLDDYDIEKVILVDKTLLIKLLNEARELSEKYKIKINIIFHSDLSFRGHKFCTINTLKEVLPILKGTRVQILLENLYMYYENELCSVLQVCKEINNEHLKMCLDVCHLYCRANMLKTPIEEFLQTYLDKDLCEKYVYQIHLSDTKDNDGYIKRETHGRTYDDIEKIKHDLNLLKQYGMQNKIIVTEVAEKDYMKRTDQIKTIKFIEEIFRGEKNGIF